jgi:aminopeptidase YwaD
MMNIRLLLAFLSFATIPSAAQDLKYAKEVLHKLCSPELNGRGYVNYGDHQAALYLSKQYKKWEIKSFDNTYFQGFSFNVNSFPGAMTVHLNDQKLNPGVDYIVDPESASINKEFEVVVLKKDLIGNSKKWTKKLAKATEDQILIFDFEDVDAEQATKMKEIWANPKPFGAKARLEPTKLTWSVGRNQIKVPALTILKSSWPKKVKKMRLKIEAKMLYQHEAQNVIGYIEGTEQPDSFILFTAHYDHLGRMGAETYFPGANDNASGTSMLLQMAAYYSLYPPKYSIAFICFAGEEAGLLGSSFYVKNPLFSLDKIRFVINMDIFGTGDEGITVVNAKDQAKEFEILTSINDSKSYLTKIKPRGQTQNSDHYPFSAQGVPAVFIYTMGGIKAYHDVFDKSETLPLDAYESLFRLLRDFTDQLQ